MGVSLSLLLLLSVFNALSVLNLTRVYRLVFLGEPQSKTRRAPEVPWLMAVPMVSLMIITIGIPLAPIKWPLWLSGVNPLEEHNQFLMQWGLPLILLSGVVGLLIGITLTLRKSWSRPTEFYLRFFQDLFAYDFYMESIYANTIVALVVGISRLTSWLDRYVIDGAVNLVSLFTIFSGSTLKYNVWDSLKLIF